MMTNKIYSSEVLDTQYEQLLKERLDYLKNKYSEEELQLISFDAAVINLGVGKINKSIHGSLGKASNFLGNQGAVLGMRYSLDLAGQTGTKLFANELKK